MPHDSPERPERAARLPAPFGARKPVVLVVDDESSLLSLACRVLERNGYAALAAPSLAAAQELLRSHGHEVHAVLLDLTLAGQPPGPAIDELRRLAPDLAVVLSSGLQIEYLDSPLDAAHAFLPKPYSTQELIACIAEALARGGRSSGRT